MQIRLVDGISPTGIKYCAKVPNRLLKAMLGMFKTVFLIIAVSYFWMVNLQTLSLYSIRTRNVPSKWWGNRGHQDEFLEQSNAPHFKHKEKTRYKNESLASAE